ncbi:MAG: hypothetical protein ABGX68_04055, partial [Methylococcales bacterium]
TGYHKVIDSIKAPWLWVKSMLSVLNLPGLFQGVGMARLTRTTDLFLSNWFFHDCIFSISVIRLRWCFATE